MRAGTLLVAVALLAVIGKGTHNGLQDLSCMTCSRIATLAGTHHLLSVQHMRRGSHKFLLDTAAATHQATAVMQVLQYVSLNDYKHTASFRTPQHRQLPLVVQQTPPRQVTVRCLSVQVHHCRLDLHKFTYMFVHELPGAAYTSGLVIPAAVCLQATLQCTKTNWHYMKAAMT